MSTMYSPASAAYNGSKERGKAFPLKNEKEVFLYA